MQTSLLEQRFSALSCREARPSSDVERNTQEKRTSAVFSSGVEEKSLIEQSFQSLSGFEARPSSDFERPVAVEHARVMVSSLDRVHGGSAEQSKLTGFPIPDWRGDSLCNSAMAN